MEVGDQPCLSSVPSSLKFCEKGAVYLEKKDGKLFEPSGPFTLVNPTLPSLISTIDIGDPQGSWDYNSDFAEDDEFLAEDDEDDLAVDGIYEITDADIKDSTPTYSPSAGLCIVSFGLYANVLYSRFSKVCQKKPQYSKVGRSYPTCGLTCAAALKSALSSSSVSASAASPVPSTLRDSSYRNHRPAPLRPMRGVPCTSASTANPLITHIAAPVGNQVPQRQQRSTNSQGNNCVVCKVKHCRDNKHVTCGLTCAEQLCKMGGPNQMNCDYCHRRPKAPGHNQCGKTCANNAKSACLLCKSRPKFKQYYLCGKTCKQIATKMTPLILDVPQGHVIYEMVENKFKGAWKFLGNPCPPIKKIYKIIESRDFLLPYDQYKKSVGNEVFRFHGTTRRCTLGALGNTRLCSNTGCALCSILKSSFKTSLAGPSGAFGGGIYTSSASNKAYSYTSGGSGALFLTKVVLGRVRQVNGWNEVMTLPAGYNSVVFNRQGGSLNETIVYSNDAIRPVFLIIF
ncbi:hypothetical protein CVT26_000153 [Gymnopilus dilepis]|uniref:PARP catalytic domain-containing protein n=1 Tax=Gymnopilus dilepis TaxID=231916 RepID=A0A409WBM1_9AGAR|nr:hypothetical protein CVT26_000153 [Gymnopilus dilepis]